MRKQKLLKLTAWLMAVVFIMLNAVAFLHAYSFTHFSDRALERTKDPKELSYSEKVKILFMGIDNPRPRAKTMPARNFKRVSFESIACWRIDAKDSKGTVILFHGYAGEKSSLLARADEFLNLGYNTLLVDFRGSGESGGNGTTIGFAESAQVKRCYDYLKGTGEEHIYLFGTSMGAAAILKSISDYNIDAEAVILECPFASLYTTVCARFEIMGVPSFPMGALLTFWGGVQNGYWAFDHEPARYATSVQCPTLLLYGAQDERVTIEETDLIFSNLKGAKVLKVYPHAGHNVFQPSNRKQWTLDVADFMNALPY